MAAPPHTHVRIVEQLVHRSAIGAGRARYKLHQQTVEPVFGVIYACIGFHRFLLRDLVKPSLE